MGRGDLTDDQWRRLRPLLPAQKPKTGRPGKDHRTVINGILWILRTGGPHGGICPSALAPGPPWPAVSTGGGGRDCGTGFWLRCSGKLMPPVRLIGRSITWTVPACGHISTLPGQKRGGRPGVGPFPGRVQHQSPSESRGSGQASDLRADPGSAARGQRVRGVDDSRGGETLRAWPSPHQASEGLRRQRVQQPQDSGLSQTTGNSLHYPPENQRTSHWPFQPGAVPAT